MSTFPDNQDGAPDAKRHKRSSSFDERDNAVIILNQQKEPSFSLSYKEKKQAGDAIDDDDDDDYHQQNLYADWKIVVEEDEANGGGGKKKRFFSVHKPVLAAPSKYFAGLFQANASFQENETSTSTFKFPCVVVKHFDAFLEYCYLDIYNKGQKQHFLSSEQLFVFLYLSDYFEMEWLYTKIKCILRGKSRRNTKPAHGMEKYETEEMVKHYHCYNRLQMPFLRDFILAWIFKRATTKEARRDLFKHVDLPFFMEVLESPNRSRGADERTEWCDHVATFCKHHGATIDASTFFAMTSQETLGEICFSKDSLSLFRSMESFPANELDDELKKSKAVLETRCIEAFSRQLSVITLLNFSILSLQDHLSPRLLQALARRISEDDVFKENPRDLPSVSDPAHLMTSLRTLLEMKKRKNTDPSFFPNLVVTIGEKDGDGLGWTYTHAKSPFGEDEWCRNGQKPWNQRFYDTYTIKWNEDSGMWELQHCDGWNRTTFFKNNTMNEENELYPPFNGWKTPNDGSPVALKIEF